MHNTFPEIIDMCQEAARLYDRIAADEKELRTVCTDGARHTISADIAKARNLVAQLRADLDEMPVPDYDPPRTNPDSYLRVIRALCTRQAPAEDTWRVVTEALADGTDLFPIIHLLPRDVLVRLAYIHTR